MKKIPFLIRLDAEQCAALAEMATEYGKPKSAIIRECIDLENQRRITRGKTRALLPQNPHSQTTVPED